MPHADVTLPGQPNSVPTARHFVESILTAWGQPEHGWTAALLISELSANCTLHARTRFTVHVDASDVEVRLSVRDGSLRAPTMRDYGDEATTGRGLHLVQQLSAEWGVELHESGKTVWAVLRHGPQDRRSPEAEEVDLDGLLASFGGDGEGDDDSVVRLTSARGSQLELLAA